MIGSWCHDDIMLHSLLSDGFGLSPFNFSFYLLLLAEVFPFPSDNNGLWNRFEIRFELEKLTKKEMICEEII